MQNLLALTLLLFACFAADAQARVCRQFFVTPDRCIDLEMANEGETKRLIEAICNDNYPQVKILLANSSNVRSLLQSTLTYGSDETINSKAWTPLFYAVTRYDSAAEKELASERIDIVNEILRYQPDLEYQDRFGHTVLTTAAMSGHLARVLALAEAGADLNFRTEDQYGGQTALMWIARTGNLETFQQLVTRGADLDTTDVHGNSLLSWAHDAHLRCDEPVGMPVIQWLRSKGYRQINSKGLRRLKLAGRAKYKLKEIDDIENWPQILMIAGSPADANPLEVLRSFPTQHARIIGSLLRFKPEIIEATHKAAKSEGSRYCFTLGFTYCEYELLYEKARVEARVNPDENGEFVYDQPTYQVVYDLIGYDELPF